MPSSTSPSSCRGASFPHRLQLPAAEPTSTLDNPHPIEVDLHRDHPAQAQELGALLVVADALRLPQEAQAATAPAQTPTVRDLCLALVPGRRCLPRVAIAATDLDPGPTRRGRDRLRAEVAEADAAVATRTTTTTGRDGEATVVGPKTAAIVALEAAVATGTGAKPRVFENWCIDLGLGGNKAAASYGIPWPKRDSRQGKWADGIGRFCAF
jgi:hypothetical protein